MGEGELAKIQDSYLHLKFLQFLNFYCPHSQFIKIYMSRRRRYLLNIKLLNKWVNNVVYIKYQLVLHS